MDAQCRKAYVSVNVDIDEEGAMQPRAIRWKNGHSFRIERVLYKCRASSNKVGGGGIRYTVQINGQENTCSTRAASGLWRRGHDSFV